MKTHSSANHKHSVQQPIGRRAIVTVMVLLVLILLAALLAEFVRRGMTDNRQMRRELHQQQAQQLAVAGIDTLNSKLAADASYAGETWEIPAGIIHQTNTGQVVISIDDTTATVIARYPNNLDQPVQVTKTVRITK